MWVFGLKYLLKAEKHIYIYHIYISYIYIIYIYIIYIYIIYMVLMVLKLLNYVFLMSFSSKKRIEQVVDQKFGEFHTKKELSLTCLGGRKQPNKVGV